MSFAASVEAEEAPLSSVVDEAAEQVVAALADQGKALATAESLTGGQLAARVTGVPGASRVYVGGVVSYATRVKRDLLGVSSELLRADGVISAACAEAMARGVLTATGADIGLATTGVAGPTEQEGHPVGTVFVAVAGAAGARVSRLQLTGSREEIQGQTCAAALSMLLAMLRGEEPSLR